MDCSGRQAQMGQGKGEFHKLEPVQKRTQNAVFTTKGLQPATDETQPPVHQNCTEGHSPQGRNRSLQLQGHNHGKCRTEGRVLNLGQSRIPAPCLSVFLDQADHVPIWSSDGGNLRQEERVSLAETEFMQVSRQCLYTSRQHKGVHYLAIHRVVDLAVHASSHRQEAGQSILDTLNIEAQHWTEPSCTVGLSAKAVTA